MIFLVGWAVEVMEIAGGCWGGFWLGFSGLFHGWVEGGVSYGRRGAAGGITDVVVAGFVAWLLPVLSSQMWECAGKGGVDSVKDAPGR